MQQTLVSTRPEYQNCQVQWEESEQTELLCSFFCLFVYHYILVLISLGENISIEN